MKKKRWRQKASWRDINDRVETPLLSNYNVHLTETRSAEPRLETKISLNFVPWESFDQQALQTEGHSKPTWGSVKLKRAKGGIQSTNKENLRHSHPPKKVWKLTADNLIFFMLCIPSKSEKPSQVKKKLYTKMKKSKSYNQRLEMIGEIL